MRTFTELVDEAMILAVEQRAALAERLLSSLDGVPDEENERLWLDEAERRLASLRAGQEKTATAQEVASKVERLLR